MAKKLTIPNRNNRAEQLIDPSKVHDIMMGKYSAALTNRGEAPFRICFEYKLANGFTFKELQQRDLKNLQRFLDKTIGRRFTEVDSLYLKRPDKTEDHRGLQVQHYAVDKKFRIHGVLHEEMFKVLRIDPNHNYHKE